jgi:hypothetical protein
MEAADVSTVHGDPTASRRRGCSGACRVHAHSTRPAAAQKSDAGFPIVTQTVDRGGVLQSQCSNIGSAESVHERSIKKLRAPAIAVFGAVLSFVAVPHISPCARLCQLRLPAVRRAAGVLSTSGILPAAALRSILRAARVLSPAGVLSPAPSGL